MSNRGQSRFAITSAIRIGLVELVLTCVGGVASGLAVVETEQALL
jgi:hypothetical protein